jgi:hypothetical protein
MAVVALGLSIAALAILAVTFRGAWFVALPLAVIALVLAIWSGAGQPRGLSRVAGVAALLLAVLALLIAVLALAASLDISNGYDVYERRTAS